MAALIRINAERTDSTCDCFISNNHVEHTPDAWRVAVMEIKFRLRPAVSAMKMTKIP